MASDLYYKHCRPARSGRRRDVDQDLRKTTSWARARSSLPSKLLHQPPATCPATTVLPRSLLHYSFTHIPVRCCQSRRRCSSPSSSSPPASRRYDQPTPLLSILQFRSQRFKAASSESRAPRVRCVKQQCAHYYQPARRYRQARAPQPPPCLDLRSTSPNPPSLSAHSFPTRCHMRYRRPSKSDPSAHHSASMHGCTTSLFARSCPSPLQQSTSSLFSP